MSGVSRDGSFEDAGQQIVGRLTVGMWEASGEIMGESLYQCPVDSGVLRRSADIEPTIELSREIVIQMGYGFGSEVNPRGRIASDYAVPVHEILKARHEPPTKAKFLEDPVMEYSWRMERDLARSIRYGKDVPLSGAIRLPIVNDGEVVTDIRTPLGNLMTRGAGGRFTGAFRG